MELLNPASGRVQPERRPFKIVAGCGTGPADLAARVHENLIQFLRQRQDAFPFRRDIDVRHFLTDAIGAASSGRLPVPAKIFLVDELVPQSYGFPLAKSPMVDELEARLGRWLVAEVDIRGRETDSHRRVDDLLRQYRDQVLKLAHNARNSSILSDYHSVFWLLHSQHAARAFTGVVQRALEARMSREEADRLKYALQEKWSAALREIEKPDGFLELLLENPLIAAEEFVGPDLRELRAYFSHMRRDYASFRRAFDDMRAQAQDLASKDKLLRRALTLLGYPESMLPAVAILDPRVRLLLGDHPAYRPVQDSGLIDSLSRRALELFVVQALRRSIIWMKTTEAGENVADDGTGGVYSRAIRPMDFGRRGVVEPIVYRYGLVYDITSFTETLGEIARGGKGEEQSSYRQMLEFQRELAAITRNHGLQFEKFLGDGAFYTCRRATRVVQAAIEIQRFYARARKKGFAFNKGMRIALNYGYYRLLPMQVSADGTQQIIEFYGPGIVELSRLTTGKTTKELEDVQHLLLSHGYDQNEVYRFFSPLARSVDHTDALQQQREFYAYVNESGHLINEGIVVSIPFLRQLSAELTEETQKVYRLRTPWSVYLGVSADELGGYVGIRLLGSVSLKGIGMQDIGEVVWLTPDVAEISMLGETKPLLQLLEQERHRTAAHNVAVAAHSDMEIGTSDLVVAETDSAILVGEWDPVSEEVRRPIRLDGIDAERYGLATPLTIQSVELQSVAYQKLYRKLSAIETLPTFSVDAVRHNPNFSGFIIGATVERL